MDRKVIAKQEDARKIIKKVVTEIGDIVGSTLGPAGRNVMIDRAYRPPEITNDGKTVAEQIIFDDELENTVARGFIEATMKAKKEAGDGSTTATVLTKAIYLSAVERIGDGESLVKVKGSNPMELYREINEACIKVVAELQKKSKPIKTQEDLYHIALCSVENEDLAKQISEMIFTLGVDAFIDVSEDMIESVEFENVQGMSLPGAYASKFFINNNKEECISLEYPVLITNQTISEPKDLQDIISKVGEQKKGGLVILAEGYSTSVLNSLVATNRKMIEEENKDGVRRFRIYGLKIPAVNNDQYEDIALFTGGTFVNKEAKMSLKNVQYEHLGQAKRVVATDGRVLIYGGNNLKSEIDSRIKDLREQAKNQTVDLVKKRLGVRIASLSSAVGIIKVGARTEIERTYLFRKINDCVAACKAALAEGVVRGGGLALKEIAEKMKENILTKALKAPYEKIQDNWGTELVIGEEVLDPVKVTRIALESACSTASTLLTTDTIIAVGKDKLENLRDILNSTSK